MSVSSIPRPLARQIDRLARRAHAFHRFAHHPLCDAYRNEVVRLGKRWRICRGCAFLGAGFITGTALGLVTRPPWYVGASALLAGLLLGAASLRARVPKWAGRFLPGAALGSALWAGWACALVSMAIIALFGVLYRRRGVERSRCDSCHERQRRPCSGFVLIVRREKAFQRRANRWLENRGSHYSRTS